MLTSPDFKELLRLFKEYDVRYLVVGGYAVMKYTEPRYTKDLDVWIATDKRNAEAVFGALREFGAPLKNLTPSDFTQEDYYNQMGRAPFRLDIMMAIPGIDFESAWRHRQVIELGGVGIAFISKADLIVSKRAAGRPKDLLDLESLEKAP